MPRAIWRRVRLERWVVYCAIAFVAGMSVWITATWVDYLAEKTAEAEAQTEHMADLLERSTARQEQLDTLLVEFREAVAEERASRAEFEAVAEAILQALDAQVERLSNEGTSSPRLEEARVVLAAAAEALSPRPRQVAGQAGGAPRPREPPQEAPADTPDTPSDTPDTPPQANPGPRSKDQPRPAPRPEQRAQPEPPPQSNRPPRANPPPQRQPKAQATQPSRPGNADPPGKARGHDRQPPAKGRR